MARKGNARQSARGSYIAQADRGSIANVVINQDTTTSRWALVVLLIVVLAVSASGVVIYRRMALPAPVVHAMNGFFNIAVAQFGMSGEGHSIMELDNEELAALVYESLHTDLHPFVDTYGISFSSPSQTGWITGTTREERAQNAEKLAQTINADVIVYGQLSSRSGTSSFTPEFYLSPRKLESAEELAVAGGYEFGAPLEGYGNPSNTITEKAFRQQLVARVRSLSTFLIGLAYYNVDQYKKAISFFKSAQAAASGDGGDGEEVLNFFLGNASYRLGDLASARAYFSRALKIKPGYARAEVGLAEVRFQESKGTCEAGHLDVAGLREAARDYQQALHTYIHSPLVYVQSPLADIQEKTSFGLGSVYLCLSQAQVVDDWAAAEREFEAVIASYQAGNQRVKELAAQAHGNLGVIYSPATDDPMAAAKYRRAAREYHEAIDMTRFASFKAYYYDMLGYIDGRLGERSAAAKDYAAEAAAYNEAIRHEAAPHVQLNIWRQQERDASRRAKQARQAAGRSG